MLSLQVFFFRNGEQSFKVCYHFFEFRNQELKPLNQLHLCHFKSAQGFFDFLTCPDQFVILIGRMYLSKLSFHLAKLNISGT